MRFHRRSSIRPLGLVALAVLLGAVIWLLIGRGRPHVIDVFPAPDAFVVPAQAPIRVTFDRPMSAAAISSAFRTDPQRSGSFTWEGSTATFTPDQPWPRGADIAVTVAGARASSGIRQAEPARWTFRTAPTLLAYLWPSSATEPVPADLYALDPDTGDIARLTDTRYGVLDFSLSPDGLSILLSVSNDVGGADIAKLDLLDRGISTLLPCGTILCTRPQYDPDGRRIVFENTTTGQVQLLGPEGETTLLSTGRFASWGPNGLLIFYDPDPEEYIVLDLDRDSRTTFANLTGEPVTWAPDGSYFLAPAIIDIGDDSFASHTLRYSFSRSEITDLTQDPLSDDNAPVISPDGTRIALARRSLAPERWTPGRQLWVMAPDGSDPAPLTETAVYHHTAFAWHPDSNQIAFVRSNQADLNEPPEIWLISADIGMPIRLVIDGFAPGWIP